MAMTMVIAIVLAVIFIIFCLLCIVAISANHKETKEFKKKIQHIEQDVEEINGLILYKLNRQEDSTEKHAAMIQKNSKADSSVQMPVYMEAVPQEQQGVVISQDAAPEESWEIELNDLIDELGGAEDFVDVATFEDVTCSEPAASVTGLNQAAGCEENIDKLSDILGIEKTVNDFDDFTRRTLHGEEPEVQIPETVIKEPEPMHVPEPEPMYEPEPAYEPEPEAINQLSPVENVDYAVGKSGKKYTSSELEKLIR